MTASEAYQKAKKAGERSFHQAVSEGRYPYLPALDDILPNRDILKPETVGIREIPVSMIAGTLTVGRREAFAEDFMPLLPVESEYAAKWMAVYNYQTSEGISDAVTAYEYMGKFYIGEGNKRVSVMRFLEQPSITADVTRILPEKTDTREYRAYQEFLRFFRCASIYEPAFTEEGCYGKLAELMGLSLDKPWPEDSVRSLKSAYYRFSTIYKHIGGNDLSLSPGDAFLLYLNFYPLGGLIVDTEKDIRRRLELIWKEFRIKAGGDRIFFSENPSVKEPPRGRLASLASFTSFLRKPRTYSRENPLLAAFLYDGEPDMSRWNHSHELGRLQMEKDMRGYVRTFAYPGCGTSDGFDRAIRDAAEKGCHMIVTTSPILMEDALRASAAYPELRFLNCSVHLHMGSVRTYYGRLYEAKFLLGALAATVAKDHRIGYVSNYPICGSYASINAFAIGASMVDPEAKIYLTWSCIADSDWRKEMYDKGLSVISGPDLVRPKKIDHEYGLFERLPDGTIRNIAFPRWNWSWYYDLIAVSMLNNAWEAEGSAVGDQALNYWWGLSSGVIDAELTEEVPFGPRKLVSTLKNAVIAGVTSPFDGELRSTEGVIKGAESPRLSAHDIVNMDWLNENVIGSVPDFDDLTETAKKAVHINGLWAAKK